MTTDEKRTPLTEWKYGGSISTGTLRPHDLVAAFYPVLWDLNHQKALRIWLHRPDDDQELVVELIDALDEEAPEGAYFGAHPGDGSDFGFWESEDLPDDGHCEVCGSTNRDEEGNLLHTKEDCFK